MAKHTSVEPPERREQSFLGKCDRAQHPLHSGNCFWHLLQVIFNTPQPPNLISPPWGDWAPLSPSGLHLIPCHFARRDIVHRILCMWCGPEFNSASVPLSWVWGTHIWDVTLCRSIILMVILETTLNICAYWIQTNSASTSFIFLS